MSEFTKILIRRTREKEKYFKNYLRYARLIKKEVEKILNQEVVLYVFGSVLRKNELVRDIDVLVISPQFQEPKKRSKVLLKVWEKIGSVNPFELHLITPQQYNNWYKYFIKEKKRI